MTSAGGGQCGYGRKREGLQPEYGQPGGWPPRYFASLMPAGRGPRTCSVALMARALPASRISNFSKEHSAEYQWNTSGLRHVISC